MRAGSTCVSSVEATSGAPCNCSTTSSSASSPRRLWPTPCQRDEETAEHRWLDRLHLVPQPRERSAAQRAQDLGVAPLTAVPARTELALDDAPRPGQAMQGRRHHADAEPEPRGDVGRRERPVRARVAPDAAPPPRRRPARAATRASPSGAACPGRRDSARRPPRRWRVPRRRSRTSTTRRSAINCARAASTTPATVRAGQLVPRQIAQPQQQIVHGVRDARMEPLGQALRVELRCA